MRVYVTADTDDREPGFVGEWLEKHGAKLEYLDRDALPSYAEVGKPDLFLLLGSARSGCAASERAVVDAESALVRDALDDGTPALGICYGAQLLAHALGGRIEAATTAEFGWQRIETLDPVLCPTGPWAQFHSDTFVPAASSRVLGTSPAGCQAYVDDSHAGRAVAWQFHPEVSGARFGAWIDQLEAYCRSHGGDPEALRSQAKEQGERGRAAAYDLTDAALSWLRP
ncbi:MAG TPA: gamma-glutamyl-gamma-aminobutyrate hydrolase family protein [Nocardioidaceae bacterium]|nr:gamma-glutamyl-gamma-aminobutyrate hydrolase family protein [Nocardioidaceae bacterium]